MVWPAPEHADEGGPVVVAEGIFATTLIATPDGWCTADSLHPGARVLTFDGGAQRLTGHHILPFAQAPTSFWPLLVPSWAMDNRDEIILLPEQKVLIEADLAEDLYGDPFALIPARALEGWHGIQRCRPPEAATAVQLRFSRHQVIYASRGLLLSCAGDPLADSDVLATGYASYSLAQAEHLMACLMAEEAGAALRLAEQHRPGATA